MLKNPTYNLALQLTQHLKSLWRIGESYAKDATACAKCKKLWGEMEKDLKRHVAALKGELKSHFEAE